MTAPRDWDKELAEIDKLMGASGGAPPPAPAALPPVRRDASAPPAAVSRPAPAHPATRPRDTVIVWSKGVLGALGGAGLTMWPYDKACGVGLDLYLLGIVAVSGAGVWAMRGAWQHRRGWAHVFGLLVFLFGLGLAAAEILPRAGYTSVPATWTCP